MDAIFERKSVRRYKEQSVEPEKIERLLRAAMAAPSAKNQQEWEFIVVTDRGLLEQLSRVSDFSKCLAHAPLAIVVLCDMNRTPHPANWEQDLGACTENILLEAVHLGLGGVWLGVTPQKERTDWVAKVCSLPEHVRTYAIVSLGYPEKEGRPAGGPERYRPDRVFLNGYGPEYSLETLGTF